ncbi:hypothetical protein [Thiomonas sp. FB-6]|uniref:hypothetical protein n=1 Tax=Thiomonas sp. FB-6 TaxID=1158291 RepID=UPI0005705E06|nr:hypothetical protein [Thiomonas sp. FB-6]
MGQKARRRATFFAEHPYCIFCGGGVAATTIEHCPPRGMFRERAWPDGFAFPACDTCNKESSDADLLVAFLKRCADPGDTPEATGALGTIKATRKQLPEVLQQMGRGHSSAIEARRLNRLFGTRPGPGELHQDVAPTRLPEEIHDAMPVFAKKLAKGLFYRLFGTAFPNEGCLLLNWFTNTEWVRTQSYPMLDALAAELPSQAIPVRRSGKSLEDQIQVRVSMALDAKLLIVQATIGHAMGLVIVGSAKPGVLERELSEFLGGDRLLKAFDVLQSTILRGGPRRKAL